VPSLFPFLYRQFSRLLNRPCRITGKDGQKLSHLEIGSLGERVAVARLRANGRRVLYRNYRGPRGGEIDIVARDGDTLSFVEVKTRTRKGYGRPLDAVDVAKQELIERGANAWLNLLGTREIPWRFDVVEVILSDGELPEVTVVENAF
jgi:putative endonuclease